MIEIDLRLDRRGELILEDIEALSLKYPRYADRAIASALKSEGYRLKGEVRQAIQSGGPAGDKWPKLNPHTGVLNRAAKGFVKNFRISRKGVKKGEAGRRVYRQRMLSKKESPLLKLAGAVRYKYSDGVLSLGFLAGNKYRGLVRKHAEGYSTPVTPKGRRRAFALGFPLKKETTSLVTPARALMEPIFDAEKTEIMKNVRVKIGNNITRYITGDSK